MCVCVYARVCVCVCDSMCVFMCKCEVNRTDFAMFYVNVLPDSLEGYMHACITSACKHTILCIHTPGDTPHTFTMVP